jgi:uncharacterized NAD-dependent epimerase/dehydratase family protein
MLEQTKKNGSDVNDTTGTAVVLTNGKFTETDAKTAHGLIRGSERFDVLAVIDWKHAGRDAGELLDGIHRNIPVFAHFDEFMAANTIKPAYAIVGVAISGGMIDESLQQILMEILNQGVSIVNGLHMLLGDLPNFARTAESNGANIIDIRRPKPFSQLNHWSGRIFEMKIPRLSVLGTDCAIGKRTTCRMLMEVCRSAGIETEMIYTGQTGWLQGNRYGFMLDATLNDFVCGELEATIIECEQNSSPDLILIEGQSGLRNPVGPCGAEIILSGNVKGIILQHAPFRKVYDATDKYGCLLPSLETEISLIESYGSHVIAVTLNGEGGSSKDLADYAEAIHKKIRRPVLRPLEDDMAEMVPVIHRFMRDYHCYAPTTLLKPA